MRCHQGSDGVLVLLLGGRSQALQWLWEGRRREGSDTWRYHPRNSIIHNQLCSVMLSSEWLGFLF